VSWRSGPTYCSTKASSDGGHLITGKIKAAHDFAGDVSRCILDPTLRDIEGDDANRVVILAGHQVGNDRFEIGPLCVGLAIDPAVTPARLFIPP